MELRKLPRGTSARALPSSTSPRPRPLRWTRTRDGHRRLGHGGQRARDDLRLRDLGCERHLGDSGASSGNSRLPKEGCGGSCLAGVTFQRERTRFISSQKGPSFVKSCNTQSRLRACNWRSKDVSSTLTSSRRARRIRYSSSNVRGGDVDLRGCGDPSAAGSSLSTRRHSSPHLVIVVCT